MTFDTNVLFADLLKKQNKRDEAEAFYRRVIDAQFKRGNSEVYILYAKAQLATLLAQGGKKEEALAMALELARGA